MKIQIIQINLLYNVIYNIKFIIFTMTIMQAFLF